MNERIAAALATNQDHLALGNEVFSAPGCRCVRNLAAPGILNANFIDSISASSPRDIEALLTRAARDYAHSPRLRFDVDARTPPEFEARLRLEPGLSCTEMLVLLLDGDLRAHPAPLDVRQLVDAPGWDAFAALHALNWREDVEDDEVGRTFAANMRRRAPPVRFWLGHIDGVPRGYLTSWEGTNGVGQVESLYVQPEFRHRGLATALLVQGVRDCRSHGAGPVVIVTDAADTPKQMYAALGWRPVAVKRNYLKPQTVRAAPPTA